MDIEPREERLSMRGHLSDLTLQQALTASGYFDLKVVEGQICAVKHFNFTYAVVVGIDVAGYERRYCFERREEAHAALLDWNGHGHPPGPWIKRKGAGVELLNPEFR